MQKLKIVGIGIFWAMLFGGMLFSFLWPKRDYSETENRILEARPTLSLQDVVSGDYQRHYEKFLNDQMFYRDSWVKLAVRMEHFMGKRDINGVYVGKDGYLLEKYEESDFDSAQIEENIACLSDFLNHAVKLYGERNVACMLLPSKANALPDRLPGCASPNDEESTVLALQSQLEEAGILLDVGRELLRHQDEYVYYRTDHHWTTLGAYYAYGMWAAWTRHPQRPLQHYRREAVFKDFYGTSYNKAPIDVPGDRVELFHSPGEQGVRVVEDDGETVSDSFYFPEEAAGGLNRYNIFFSKNTAKIEIKTKSKTGRTLLLVKDSFANCFVPFLAEHYDRIIMVDCRYSKENTRDIIAQCDSITDVLVIYNIEKFMQDTNLRFLNLQSDTMQEFDLF